MVFFAERLCAPSKSCPSLSSECRLVSFRYTASIPIKRPIRVANATYPQSLLGFTANTTAKTKKNKPNRILPAADIGGPLPLRPQRTCQDGKNDETKKEEPPIKNNIDMPFCHINQPFTFAANPKLQNES